MTTANTILTSYQAFADEAAPWLHIIDDVHYEEALALIETLLEQARDDPDDPLNGLIELLTQAIANYEAEQEPLQAFHQQAQSVPADVAILRLLMEQHHLGTADFPEIGDKSLISRIARGERNLTKQHIEKLAARFQIAPGSFFQAA